ncbi:MAG: C10 family peptidase [Bacteroidaceae bacterium]|nr:C10 family peptidase [Bacteroidaceae bacterium]
MRRFVLPTLLCLLSLNTWGQAEYTFPENIKPLIKTRWGQGIPYNLLCPKIEKDDGTTVYKLAGCGALAMAQMVNYHRYPHISPDGVYEYNWDNMFNTYQEGISTDRLIGVAKLISDCGVSSFTNYTEDFSSTNLSAIMGAMKRIFRYNNYLCLYKRDDFSTPARDSLYRSLIFSELKAGRPIIYRGYSEKKEDGHLFLIDGCKGSKVHTNMGWAGSQNDYYDLDDLAGYSKSQWMLIEIADTTFQPEQTTVRLNTPGTLHNLLTAQQQQLTRHIKLAGELNAADFALLRKMLKEGVLRTIDMEEVNMRQLPDSAFFEMENLSHFIAPRILQNTGRCTFYSCRNLNRIVFHQGLETIGNHAFSGCNNLLEVRLPSTTTTILNNAFTSCEALLNVILPDGINRIGGYAFSYCKHLNSIHLPRALRNLGITFTHECPKLKRITLDPTNPFYYVEGLEVKKKE